MEDETKGIAENKRYSYQSMLLGIIILLLFVMAWYFYNRMYFGEYKSPHKEVYTNHDYFIEMASVDGEIKFADYVMYMYSAFNSMIGNREAVVDSRVITEDYRIMIPKHTKDEIGVLNTNFEDEAPACQKYYLLDENGEEHKVFVLTGRQWESASVIKIFYDMGNNLIISPAEIFNKNDFLDTDIQLKSFSCETVRMQIEIDETIQRITGEQHKKEISIRQLGFILFIASLGIITGGAFLKKTGVMAIWFILPFGFMSQIFSVLILIISHLKISLLNYILISYAVAVSLNIYIKKHSDSVKIPLQYNKKQVINILLWAGIVLWFCFRPHVILSYDSVLNEYYGKYAILTGDLNTVLDGLLSYSLITPLYEVGSALFGIELNYSIQPILIISFMAAMGWIWFNTIKNPAKIKLGIILWGILALIVNPMFYIQTFWKLNNLSLGMFVGISVGMHLLYYMTEQKIYFIMGNLFFAVVCIARVEGGVFAVVHLVCLYVLLRNKNEGNKVENLCLKMAFLLTVLYFYYFYIIGQVDSPFWTPKKGFVMNILVWLVYLFFRIAPMLKGSIRKISDSIDIVMAICISAVIIGFGIFDSEKFIHNMFSYICNLGNYGGYWVVTIMTALYGIFYVKGKPIIRFLSIYVIAYSLLIPGLMIFREVPLRIGFGDSACRMLSHIVIVGGYLLIYFANSLFVENRETPKIEKEMTVQ